MPSWPRLIQPPAGRLLRWMLPFALLCALAPGLALRAEVQVPPLLDVVDETARIVQASSDLAAVAARREEDRVRLAARLAREEESLRARDIDPDMLRAARLALDTTRERLDTLSGQAAHQRATLVRLEQGILALARAADSTADTPQAQERRQAASQLLRDQADAVEGLANQLDQLIAINQRLLILDKQRLRLLQARVRLDAFGELPDPVSGSDAGRTAPTAVDLETTVTASLRAGAELSAEVATITGDDPDATARREALETRLHDVMVQGDLAQNALELLGIRRRVEGLIALREDRSMPATLLEAAANRLREIRDELQEYLVELQAERGMIATRLSLSRGAGASETTPIPAADLEAAIARQEQQVQALLQQADQEHGRLSAAAAQVYGESLADRHPFPVAGEEWRRIGSGVRGLPRLLADELGFMGRDIVSRATAQGPARWLGLILGGLVLVFGAFTLPGVVRRTLVDPDPSRRVAAPARALTAAIPPAIPAALWTWIGLWLALPSYEFLPVLLLLGLWPVSVFVLTLARGALFGHDANQVSSPARLLFYQRLRWGLILAAVVAALYILTGSLPVSPLLSDVLDRLAMIGLLLLAVPVFGLRGLIRSLAHRRQAAATSDTAPGSVRLGTWLLSELTRLIAVAMVVAGVLGLLGYANLAWAVTSRLGWLALVAILLYFVVGILGDLRDRAAERIDGEQAEFWRQYFLTPAQGLAVLLAWLVAGWGLFRLWGWSARTPPVRALLDWARRPLVEAGSLSLTPWDLAISVLLVAAAVSVGAWVKRVSFQLAFGRVRDRGLRQALATLTQYVVMVCGVLFALQVSGLNLTTLVVFTASLGVGIGFGLQNIVNNFISGVLILVERPLRVGDIVTVGGHEGEVTRIGIRSLTVRTFDKQEVFIPNGTVISGDFINWTRSDDILRTVLTIGISYQDDPDQAIALISSVLAGYEPVLRQPAPRVSLWEFGDSAIGLRVEYCVHYKGDVTRTAVHSEVNRRIWYGFKAAGISIPFPQRDLHVSLVPPLNPSAVPDGLPGPLAAEAPGSAGGPGS